MHTLEINRALQNIKCFGGTVARNRIPKPPRKPIAFVVNTDSIEEPGEHWVTILLLPNEKGEYFDPFGFPPLIKDIQMYLNEHCSNGLTYNSRTVQHCDSHKCGEFCVAFLNLRQTHSFEETMQLFCGQTKHNDQLLRRTIDLIIPVRRKTD